MPRVLIVDDHEVFRRGLEQILIDQFDAVTLGEAGNSQEAIEMVVGADWDIILLDIKMPGKDGLDLLQDLKRLKPKIPILLLSAYPEEQFAVRALKLGASGYLTKEAASDELVEAIKKALGGGTYVNAMLAEQLAVALRKGSPKLPHEILSAREFQVMQMVAQGKSVKEIAWELSLSEKTIGTHRARVLEKLNLKNDVEIARYALHNHLVD